MGIRSNWFWRISEQVGVNIHDAHELRAYLSGRGIRVVAKSVENLEAIAFYLGVPDAQNIPLQLQSFSKQRVRGPRKQKSKLSNMEILELRSQGKSLSAIAQLAGVSRQAIFLRIAQHSGCSATFKS